MFVLVSPCGIEGVTLQAVVAMHAELMFTNMLNRDSDVQRIEYRVHVKEG